MTYTDEYPDHEVIIGIAPDGSAIRGDARMIEDRPIDTFCFRSIFCFRPLAHEGDCLGRSSND